MKIQYTQYFEMKKPKEKEKRKKMITTKKILKKNKKTLKKTLIFSYKTKNCPYIDVCE